MEKMVEELARLRALEAAALQKKLDLLAALDATPEAASLAAHNLEMAQLHMDLVMAEGGVREAALAAHQMTGDKHPHPAVTVKMFTTVTYDAARAKAYCIDHGIAGALKLDPKPFEKAAPALGLEWVEFGQEPRAAIATDLSAWVPAAEPEPAESPCEGCTKSISITGRLCNPDVGDACYPAPEPTPSAAPVPIAA